VRGERITRIAYSSVQPRRRLATWLDLVTLTASEPARPWTAVMVGRQGTGARAARYPALEEDSGALLRDLVAVYDAGMREPLPLPVKTSAAWAEAAHRGQRDRVRPARLAWEGKDYGDPFAENHDAAFGMVFGPRCPWQQVCGTPRDGEDGTRQGTRLGAYAVRVWEPLLRRERLGAL
jgi:exodeoxyribonuclease V gamma subunit